MSPPSPDHWTRRTAIMTLMAGVAGLFSGFSIAKLDAELGRQITLTGVCLAVVGAIAWFIIHRILEGSQIDENE